MRVCHLVHETLNFSMEFKPYQTADVQAYVEFINTANPTRPTTAERVQYFDSTREASAKFARYWVLESSIPIAVVSFETPMSNPAPNEYSFELVLPTESKHLAKSLFMAAQPLAARLEPKLWRVVCQEDHWQYKFFLEQGFNEFDRMWASQLPLEDFSFVPFQTILEKAKSAGLTIRTLADELSDPSFLRRYYDAVIEILYDIPAATPLQPWSFDLWKQRLLEDPTFLPEAQFIGFIGREIVGVSQLFTSARAATIQTGLTGVRGTYRHQGFAFALKLEAAQYAQKKGFKFVRTNNHVINRPMLTINEALGFMKEPATIYLRKEI